MSKLEDIVKIQEEVSVREGRKVSILEAAMRYDHPWLFTGPKIIPSGCREVEDVQR